MIPILAENALCPWTARLLELSALVFLLAGCQSGGTRQGGPEAGGPARDVHSLARPQEVRVTHAELDWRVDFEARRLRGSVTWSVARSPDHASAPLVLDTQGLAIEAVTTPKGTPLPYALEPPHPALGAALRITLPAGEDKVLIRYSTAPEARALQWLTPAQTAGGAKPFMFSQAQSILARSMLPCQDSPAVRVTYAARVSVPPGLVAVMAARRLPGGGGDEPYSFEMPQPIPSYLIAIAAGDLQFRELGTRTGVYAEPAVVERAAREFADTEAMMAAAERLYGPYRWERYDLLVLPPSFPFGGMENPRLTFATPTILAGDRSLVSVVAHELAHSWSGNLVTNATWSDFWLNEGFTVYLERRILEEIYGPERAEIEAVLGKQDLLEEMRGLEPGFTVLHNTSLDGRDPDDAFSEVPYEKGYLLLRVLEQEVGRPSFDAFLRRWFDDNAFQSRTTADFERDLRDVLLRGRTERLEALRVREWLHEPGLPPNAPEPQSAALAAAQAEAVAFAAGSRPAAALPAKDWSTQEWLRFLRALPAELSSPRLGELDAAWSLSQRGNAEILCQWLLTAIRGRYERAYPALERFLTAQGRRKFIKPIYEELVKTAEGKRRALEIYGRARPGYHPVAVNTIDGIVGRK